MDKGAMVEMLINSFSKGNKRQFSVLLGVSPQTISAWVSRGTFDAELIYKKCIGVSSRWLLTGEGDMLEESNKQGSATAGNGSVAVAGNVTAHHITANSSCENAVLQERVKSLEALLAEKERLIKVYEKMAEGKQ